MFFTHNSISCVDVTVPFLYSFQFPLSGSKVMLVGMIEKLAEKVRTVGAIVFQLYNLVADFVDHEGNHSNTLNNYLLRF